MSLWPVFLLTRFLFARDEQPLTVWTDVMSAKPRET
jgi:hypothetical protein